MKMFVGIIAHKCKVLSLIHTFFPTVKLKCIPNVLSFMNYIWQYQLYIKYFPCYSHCIRTFFQISAILTPKPKRLSQAQMYYFLRWSFCLTESAKFQLSDSGSVFLHLSINKLLFCIWKRELLHFQESSLCFSLLFYYLFFSHISVTPQSLRASVK